MPTIYGDTTDGGTISLGNASFVAGRTSGGSNSYSGSTTFPIGGILFSPRGGGQYIFFRCFFVFDTSGISVTPDAATLKLYGFDTDTADLIAVKPELSLPLAAGDFNSYPSAALTALGNSDGSGTGTLAGVSGFTYSSEITSWDISGYNDIALNATALADMVSLDKFFVGIMEYDHDYLDITNATTTYYSEVYFADETGTSKDPYIDYTTAAVAVTDNATFFGANF